MCYRNKEVTEAGKLAYISFFEIRPIIFSLREDAKLGKPVRSKQKMRERCTIKVLWARALERAHVTRSSLPAAPFNLRLLQGSSWYLLLWWGGKHHSGRVWKRPEGSKGSIRGTGLIQTSEDGGWHQNLLIPSSGFQILNLPDHSFPNHSYTHWSL